MWQNKVNGILGIWLVGLAFIPFSSSMQKALLIVTGLAIIVTAFLGRFIIRPAKDVSGSASREQGGDGEKFDPNQF